MVRWGLANNQLRCAANGSWNGTNAAALLAYAQMNDYMMDFELGNGEVVGIAPEDREFFKSRTTGNIITTTAPVGLSWRPIIASLDAFSKSTHCIREARSSVRRWAARSICKGVQMSRKA